MPHTAHSADEIIVDFVPGSHSWAPLLSHTTFRSLAVTPSHLPVLNGVNDPTCFSFSPQTHSETGQSTSHQAHDLPRSIFCILAWRTFMPTARLKRQPSSLSPSPSSSPLLSHPLLSCSCLCSQMVNEISSTTQLMQAGWWIAGVSNEAGAERGRHGAGNKQARSAEPCWNKRQPTLFSSQIAVTAFLRKALKLSCENTGWSAERNAAIRWSSPDLW